MKVVIIGFLILTLVFLLGGIDPCQSAPLDKPIKAFKFEAGNLKGVVKDAAGKPVPNLEMSILNEKGAVVQKVVTDSKGQYLFKGIAKGNYTLKVAGKTTFALQAAEGVGTQALEILVPVSVRETATGAIATGALTALEWAVIVVGTTGLAVGVPAVIHHNKEKHPGQPPVSP